MNIKNEMLSVLQEQVIPFWLERGVDREHGGYLTCFDERGEPTGDSDKYIVTLSSFASNVMPDIFVLTQGGLEDEW